MNDSITMSITTLIAVLIFTIGIICFVGVTDEDRARRTIEGMGLTPVEVGGYGYFSCGKDDWYKTRFTAKNEKGIIISGTVCSGMFFKGSTVRFD